MRVSRLASATVAALLLQLFTHAAAPPRLAPLDEAQWDAEQRALVMRFQEPEGVGNDLRIYVRHPVMLENIAPFERYISNASTLSPRHRELLILRTAWLCRSEYVWAHHAPRARQAGVTSAELARIGRADTAGWAPFEADLLRAADQLHDSAFVDDATWAALAAQYDPQHLMDAVFTAAEFTLVSEMANSLHVPLEASVKDSLPAAGQRQVIRNEERLIGRNPRITPLDPDPSTWTPEVRAWLQRNGSGRRVANVYRTYARHLPMDKPRTLLSEHIRQTSTLPAKARELLIMRIGFLCRSEYEWAAHAPAGRRAGMTEAEIQRVINGPDGGGNAVDDALLRATGELYRNDVISDSTWKDLSAAFDPKQLLDILVTVGGYRGVSMALNSIGVQLEPNAVRFPETAAH